jgi:hypothetical protein
LTNIKNDSCTILQNIQNYKKLNEGKNRKKNRTEEEEEEEDE